MKNIYRILIMISVFGAGLFSCNTDLLEPTNKTSLSDKVVFNDPSRIELQANALYSFVKSGNFMGGRYLVYGDIRANDFINRTTNGVTGYPVWNHTLTETDINAVNNMWNAAYSAINQCNVFIKGLTDNADKFIPPTFAADFGTTSAPAYMAEARLIRALAYYGLLQYYARPFSDGAGSKPGLPLRLNAETSSENNSLPRSTVAEVYAQIISDLDFAEQNLPLTRGTASLNVTRAHRNTAIALKTRVYLSMGDYAKVVIEGSKIVTQSVAPFSATTGVAHALEGSISSVFATPQETAESILSFPFSAQNTPGTQNQLAFYFRASGGTSPGGGEYNLNSAGILADLTNWPATDARRGMTYVYNGESYLSKYPSGTPYLDKAPVIRYSEVLLNLAEGIARTTTGVDAKALALLNAVRKRADATVTLTPADNTALINAILTERRIEFLGEGLRNGDLMRLLSTIPGKGAVLSVATTANEYIWPIPSGELATNGAMTRN